MSSALNLLLERAEKELRDAAAAVEQAHRDIEGYRQQLAQIEQYRLDYFSQMTQRGIEGLSASEYGHLQRFISQLDNTLAQQQQAGSHFEQQLASSQQLFNEKRKAKRSIEWLLEKKAAEKAKADAHREQLQMDEFATLQAARKLLQSQR